MGQLITQLFGPDSSALGRVLAFFTLGAVVIFFGMARASLNASAQAEREAREADERAEAIVREVRRELAAKNGPKE